MKEKIKSFYSPMREKGFYILLCLQDEMHGYSIAKKVKEITNNEVIISAGTMYGNLSKMEKDGLIRLVREEGRQRTYCITDLGREILRQEISRIQRLYNNASAFWKNK